MTSRTWGVIYMVTVIVAAVALGILLWLFNDAVQSADDKLYRNNLAGCERGNILRESVNDEHKILYDFLDQAVDRLRKQQKLDVEPAKKRLDKAAADKYAALRDKITQVPVPICAETINRP